MKILYVGMKYDYGRPEQGLSFEHNNFYHSLVCMGHDILYFDFMTLLEKYGRPWLNRRLLEIVKSEKPDLLFSLLFTDQFDLETLRAISVGGDTVTLNWFTDDHWRFEDFSCHWAPCFNWSVTTSTVGFHKYHLIGYQNVIKSQWACNNFLYRPLDLPLVHDVTFVGQPHGDRREVVDALIKRGIGVRVWGTGWASGRVSQEEMIRVFNQSRINLNLSNASVAKDERRMRLVRIVSKILDKIPKGTRVKRSFRSALSLFRKASSSGVLYPEQIKGRNFEVPGCGGFLLTGLAEDLEEYYVPGIEVGTFQRHSDLAEKIKYYLTNEDERNRVARAGYERTLKEHTYVHRLSSIFQQLNLPSAPAEDLLRQPPPPGETEEIL